MSEEVEVIVPVLVIRSVEGKIEDVKIYTDRSLEDVLREYGKKALDEWNPMLSDFTIMRTFYELRYKLPIDPDLYDVIEALELEMMREGNELIVKLPVYTISFDNRWSGENYRDLKVYVVTYLIDESVKNQLVEYAAETTAREKSLEPSVTLTEEQLQRLEEGLREAEQVEAEEEQVTTTTSSKRRRTRKSRKK